MAIALVTLTKCFCILITVALGQGIKVYSNMLDPEAISQIYRTAVKNNEPVILTFDIGPYSRDVNVENTGNEYKEAQNYGNNRIGNLKDLLKSVHHKHYLEKIQKIKDLSLELPYKHGALRTETGPEELEKIRQETFKKFMGSRNEMQCKERVTCNNRCKIRNDVKCKTTCDMKLTCDKEKKDKEDDCSSDDECDETTPDSSEPSNTAVPPYQKGSEESSDCDDE